MGIVCVCCKVFDAVKVGSNTLLAELSFRHAFYVARVVRVAGIRAAWLVYVRTYCVPIATLNQNKYIQVYTSMYNRFIKLVYQPLDSQLLLLC